MKTNPTVADNLIIAALIAVAPAILFTSFMNPYKKDNMLLGLPLFAGTTAICWGLTSRYMKHRKIMD